jgi:hypothetical protein
VGSRRRRREVGDGPDAWGRSVSERREGEGKAGRRWLLGQKSKLARGLLWWAGKNKRGGEREGGPRGVKEDVGRVGLEENERGGV